MTAGTFPRAAKTEQLSSFPTGPKTEKEKIMTEYHSSAEDPGTKTPPVKPTSRPLKVGINLPVTEGALAGKTARWADLFALASQAEALGFDSLWVPDHLLVQTILHNGATF